MTLTDDQIDRLSGVELRDAVARAKGWTTSGPYWYAPGEHEQPFKAQHAPPFDVNDKGAALGLLMTIDNVVVQWSRGSVEVFHCDADGWCKLVVTGPIADCASVMCRAFLKLTQRKES